MNTEQTTPSTVNITVKITPEAHRKACELAAEGGYSNISSLFEHILEAEAERVGLGALKE